MSAETIETADRLTFWRNWYDGFRQYPDELRLAAYDAILAFAFDGVEPTPSSGDIGEAIKYQAVAMIRATVDISRKRRENGAKGGSKTQAKRKQKPGKEEANASKAQAKRKQNQARPKQEQVQEQDKEQEQEHNANSLSATARGNQPPTRSQFLEMAALAGVPDYFAGKLYNDLAALDWTDAKGLHVDNPRRYLKSAWNAEQKKIRAARAGAESMGPLGNGIQCVR